jgi:hypothetical protein
LTDQFTLSKGPRGFGWEWFDGPFFSFVDGGAAMFDLGVPGWEDFAL